MNAACQGSDTVGSYPNPNPDKGQFNNRECHALVIYRGSKKNSDTRDDKQKGGSGRGRNEREGGNKCTQLKSSILVLKPCTNTDMHALTIARLSLNSHPLDVKVSRNKLQLPLRF